MQKTHNKSRAPRPYDADVIIVGGGPAGCSLAALLGSHGLSVICIDQDDPARALDHSYDGRTTAISYASRFVMEAAGVWEDLIPNACPIEDIQIMESGSACLLEFLVKDVEGEAFGWIVENRLLRQSLYARLAALPGVIHRAPAKVADYAVDEIGADVHLSDGTILRAKLVVGADGRQSFTRQWMGLGTRSWSYHQSAVVCVVEHENPHSNIAIEDFRAEGPFAVLPMCDDAQGKHRSSIVWTQHGDMKHSPVHWDEQTFNAALNERFPAFYGQVRCAGKRFSYPLGLVHAHDYVGARMALIADAAHGIHPIAGQGLNIGLRDVAELAEQLVKAHKNHRDIGDAEILNAYERARRLDNMAMAAATDGLNRLFSNNNKPLHFLRKTGLRLVQRATPVRKFFMRKAMGSAGILPSIVKGEKIP